MSRPEGFEDEATIAQRDAKEWRHPYAVFCFLAFRVAAAVAYMLCLFISSNFVLNFVTIVVLLSMDFWTVKNISGRILVGLRWWNQVADDGTSKWVFEARANNKPQAAESRVFWWGLYLTQALWFLFAITAIIKLYWSYLLIVIVAISFNGANIVGYRKCDQHAKTKASASNDPSSIASNIFSKAAGSIGTFVVSSMAKAATATA